MKKLLVFSDDWGRHPSSCQHLIRQLLSQSSVTWVNTIGMRPPRFDLLTVRRGIEKLTGWLAGKENHDSSNVRCAEPKPTIIDAKMWPWMKYWWDRRINRMLIEPQLRRAAEGAVAITTIPIVADWTNCLSTRKWVYYCVDDFSVWPGLDGQVLGRLEDALLPKVDRIIAASEHLATGIRDRGFEANVLSHGVDTEFWSTHGKSETNPPAHKFEKPIYLFWGVVDRRMNADWVLSLANRLDQGCIVLLGPEQDADPRLKRNDRIFMPGAVPFDSLPEWASAATALLMPYDDVPVTRAMQPLKLKEYLATGRPVVTSKLPAVEPWQDCLEMVRSEEEFVDRVLRVGDATNRENLERRRLVEQRLSAETWKAKAAVFNALIGS